MQFEFRAGDILDTDAEAVVIPHTLHDDIIPELSRRIMDAACGETFTMMFYYKEYRGNGYEIGKDFVDEGDFCEGCFTPYANEYPIITVMPGYKLKARHTIHICVPAYKPFYDEAGEINNLCRCYEMALNVAKRENIASIVFPLLGTDVFGYPYDFAYAAVKFSVEKWIKSNEAAKIKVYVMLPEEKQREGKSFPLPDFAAGSVFVEYAERMAREIAHSHKDRFDFFRSRVTYYLSKCPYSDGELENMIDCDHTVISRLRTGKISATNKRRAVALAVCMGLSGYEFYEFVVSAAIKHRYPSDEFDMAVESVLASGAVDFRKINAELRKIDLSYALDTPVKKSKSKNL